MVKLNFSPEAENDLRQIKSYISNDLNNPEAAINIISGILGRCRELATFPNLGASLESIIKIETNYRYLISGNYTIFYRYKDTKIYIDRILYSRRNFIKILFS
jgi:addiction module RelE/StbE family toxin